jgi:16S rRNA (cytosine1402-N4)-methyltransferase
MKPGGRVAILTFHSGEDRRVKKAFQSGERERTYSAIAHDIIRAGPDEIRDNPRSRSAKLRWAQRT